jgi:glycosyltransferase involved in cell wall biosynthesis
MQRSPVTVWINGRFLTRKVTGVERVAHSLLKALSSRFASGQSRLVDAQGNFLEFRIAVPSSAVAGLPGRVHGMPVHGVGRCSGHLWEQIDLARLPAQDWLLNLCNTGPICRRRQGFMFHDAQVYAIPGNFTWKFRTWYRALFGLGGRRARFLLTNSEFSRDEISRHTGIEPDKFTVMHLGADHFTELLPEMPEALQARLPAQPFVLAVSSLNPNKNFATVVKALELLREQAPACVIVGQEYASVFGDAQLDMGKVTHLGYVSDEALSALYRQALCLVYPSLYEGFGLPPVEAMSCGCPVIVSRGSSLPEVCGQAALYCDPRDPQSLADHILRMLRQPGLAREMSDKGLEQAAVYTWDRAAEKMLWALGRAVSREQGRSSSAPIGAR